MSARCGNCLQTKAATEWHEPPPEEDDDSYIHVCARCHSRLHDDQSAQARRCDEVTRRELSRYPAGVYEKGKVERR